MLKKRLIGISAALAAVGGAGTSGYVILEGWPPLDAFYMTVITISSVGFMEVHPLSDGADGASIGGKSSRHYAAVEGQDYQG